LIGFADAAHGFGWAGGSSMNTTTPPETVVRLKRSLRRVERAGWALGALLALSGVGVAVSPGLWFGSPRTEGSVIKLEPEVELVSHGTPQAGDIVWFEEIPVAYPVVEYEVGDRRFTYRPRSAFRTYNVGEKVPLLYKADRPGVARIDTFAHRWLVPLLVGGSMLAVGAVVMAGAALSKQMVRQFEAALMEGSRGAEGPDPTTSSPAEPGPAAD
jgi:hypothetical protein